MLHVTCSIPHPDGAIKRITSSDIERLYEISESEYAELVIKEPIGDNGRLLKTCREYVAVKAAAPLSSPCKIMRKPPSTQPKKVTGQSSKGVGNGGKTPDEKVRTGSKRPKAGTIATAQQNQRAATSRKKKHGINSKTAQLASLQQIKRRTRTLFL